MDEKQNLSEKQQENSESSTARTTLLQTLGIPILQEKQRNEEECSNSEYIDLSLSNAELTTLFREIGIEVDIKDIFDYSGDYIATVINNVEFLKVVTDANENIPNPKERLWYMFVSWDIDDTLAFSAQAGKKRYDIFYEALEQFGLEEFVNIFRTEMERYTHDYSVNVKGSNNRSILTNYVIFAFLIREMERYNKLQQAAQFETLEEFMSVQKPTPEEFAKHTVIQIKNNMEQIRENGGLENSEEIARQNGYPFCFDKTGKFVVSHAFLSSVMADKVLSEILFSCIHPMMAPEINEKTLEASDTLARKKQNEQFQIFFQGLFTTGDKTTQILKALHICQEYTSRFKRNPPFALMIVTKDESKAKSFSDLTDPYKESTRSTLLEYIQQLIHINDRPKTLGELADLEYSEEFFDESRAVRTVRIRETGQRYEHQENPTVIDQRNFTEISFRPTDKKTRWKNISSALVSIMEKSLLYRFRNIPKQLRTDMTYGNVTYPKGTPCYVVQRESLRRELKPQYVSVQFPNGKMYYILASKLRNV